jgi:hypothetical protein
MSLPKCFTIASEESILKIRGREWTICYILSYATISLSTMYIFFKQKQNLILRKKIYMHINLPPFWNHRYLSFECDLTPSDFLESQCPLVYKHPLCSGCQADGILRITIWGRSLQRHFLGKEIENLRENKTQCCLELRLVLGHHYVQGDISEDVQPAHLSARNMST